jgi:hypothetical protein
VIDAFPAKVQSGFARDNAQKQTARALQAQKKSRDGGSQEFNREASNRVAKPLGKNPAELDVND